MAARGNQLCYLILSADTSAFFSPYPTRSLHCVAGNRILMRFHTFILKIDLSVISFYLVFSSCSEEIVSWKCVPRLLIRLLASLNFMFAFLNMNVL